MKQYKKANTLNKTTDKIFQSLFVSKRLVKHALVSNIQFFWFKAQTVRPKSILISADNETL